jgi:DME family drug/metabolite transporter
MNRGRLLVLASALCFSTTGTAAALGVDGASPVTVGAARIVVGALGLLLLVRAALPRFGRTVWLGALGVAGYQPAFFLAVRETGVAVGTVVALGSAPVVTGLLAWALRRGSPGARWAAATALAAAGLVVLATGGGTGGGRVQVAGVLLALVAATSYAVYTLATKELLDAGVPAEAAVAAVFTGGALLLAPALVLLPSAWIATPAGAAEVLFLGLVPTTLAYVLFARGLRHVSAAETSTLTLAEPLAATLLGVALLGERLTAPTVAGGLLLVTGLAVLALPRRRRRTTAAAPLTPAGPPTPAGAR